MTHIRDLVGTCLVTMIIWGLLQQLLETLLLKTGAVERQTKETKRMKVRVPAGPGAVRGMSLDADILCPVIGPETVSLTLSSAGASAAGAFR